MSDHSSNFVAGELMSATKLILKGFKVSIPLGHITGYDLVSDWYGKVNRIQVKTTTSKHHNCWKLNVRRRNSKGCRPYTLEDFDFLLARIKETGDTYILPVSVLNKSPSLLLHPGSSHKLEMYHEAYNLLKGN
jgi:PD-(D/E)XK endonuclease